MDRIIRIDVSAPGGPVATEVPLGKYVGFGGRALTSAIVHDEVPPQSHALSEQNKLIIAPGLMAGSAASTSCRLSVGCKSPLTGALHEVNSGGQAARHLGELNIAAITIEGAPSTSKLHKVFISRNGVRIEPAEELKGLTNHAVCDRLYKVHDNNISIISIGPAGERRMSNSTIAVTDSNALPTCHTQCCGVGAVMGAKGIKCIAIDPTGTTSRNPANPERFHNANKAFVEGIHRHDFSARKHTASIDILARILNGAGKCPAFNARALGLLDQAAITLQEHKRTPDSACLWACSINCTGEYLDKDGNYIFKAPSYESHWAFGQHCGIVDTEALAELNFLVEDFGFDCIEMGMAIRIAMDAGIIDFGDADGTIRLVKEAREATPLGRIIGSGAETAARCFGLPFSLPTLTDDNRTCDARLLKVLGTAYATSLKKTGHANNACNREEYPDSATAAKCRVDITRNLEIAIAALDSIGFCLFSVFAILDQPETLDAMVEIINGMFDIKLTDSDFVEIGKLVLRMEHDFNKQAGIPVPQSRLPLSFSQELLATHNIAFEAFDRHTTFSG